MRLPRNDAGGVSAPQRPFRHADPLGLHVPGEVPDRLPYLGVVVEELSQDRHGRGVPFLRAVYQLAKLIG